MLRDRPAGRGPARLRPPPPGPAIPPPNRPSTTSTTRLPRASSGGRRRSHRAPTTSTPITSSPPSPNGAKSSLWRPSTTKVPGASSPTGARFWWTSAACGKPSAAPRMPPPPCSPPRAVASPRAADLARELLPDRYPFVAEFRRALALDPANIELRRELAYLLLRMERESRGRDGIPDPQERPRRSARRHSARLPAPGSRRTAPPSPSSTAFWPAATRISPTASAPCCTCPRSCAPAPAPRPASIDAWVMAERSIKAGYMKDAVKYLEAAHEDGSAPTSTSSSNSAGPTTSCTRTEAFRWFDLARKSPDPRSPPKPARPGRSCAPARALSHLRLGVPLFSTRWHDVFSYGQVKIESPPRHSCPSLLERPRCRGHAPPHRGRPSRSRCRKPPSLWPPASPPTRGTAWSAGREAGQSLSYLNGRLQPDYRGGLSVPERFRRYVLVHRDLR